MAVASAMLVHPSVTLGSDPFFLLAAGEDEPVAVAATVGKLLYTRPLCGRTRSVMSVDATGSVSEFARLPDRLPGVGGEPPCFEDHLTIVPAGTTGAASAGFPTPNPAGFASNYIYVTQGPTILQITPDGAQTVVWKTLPMNPDRPGKRFCDDDVAAVHHAGTSITFDRVGTFRFRMIVLCQTGEIFLLDKSARIVDGSVTGVETNLPIARVNAPPLFSQLPPPFEGPEVAPMSFAPFGGHLLVAAENASDGSGSTGLVLAVKPEDGTVRIVARNVMAAEGVRAIPLTKAAMCNFGGQGIFFTTGFPDRIIRIAKTAFLDQSSSPLSGVLVTSEKGALGATEGLTRLFSTGGTINRQLFRSFDAPLEGATFVDCSVPLIVRLDYFKPVDFTQQLIAVTILSNPPLLNAATDIVRSTLRFGVTGSEPSLNFVGGVPDCTPISGALQCNFKVNLLGVPLGPDTAQPCDNSNQFPGPGFKDGDCPFSLILKGSYVNAATGNDPPLEGD